MKDIYTPRVIDRNEKEALLHAYRLDKYLTVRKLCEMAEVKESRYYQLQSGVMSPMNDIGERRGEIRDDVIRLCEVLECEPADVFPRYFCAFQRAQVLLDDQILDITMGEWKNTNSKGIEDIIDVRVHDLLEYVSGRIPERNFDMWYEFVIEKRSLFDISEKNDVLYEQVRQIIIKTKNKLKFLLYNHYKRFDVEWRELHD